MTDSAPKHPFSADRPIISRTEDLLGRSGFAESLASAIRGWRGKDSLVLALYGPWGSGKSSIKNMTLESLHESKDNCPQTVEFNPWQWAGQDQLAEAFFREIGLALGRTDTSKKSKRRALKWRAYGAYLKAGSFLVDGFRKAIIGLLVIIALVALVGIGGSFIDSPWIKSALLTTGVIALFLAAISNWVGTFAEKIAAAFQARSEASGRGLPELKKELAELLRELKTPVIVVIDDVDRLSTDEIKLLFQLVKANADFPNLVYLLLFQRDVVEKSLEPVTGRDFLEKIVQVGFDIPRIERTRLEKVLFAGLNVLLADEKVGQRFDQQRWGNMFIPGLRPYFDTLRDVHRFLATLSFQVARFRQSGSFEVNPIDLIALEVLRVFEPKVYQRLPDAKSALTELRDHALRTHGADDETRNLVKAIVDRAPETNRAQVCDILKQLFPPAEWIFGGSHYGSGFEEQWFRDLRICHPNVFDRYFHLTIPEGDVSQADLDQILSLVSDREGLVTELRALNQRGLLGAALDRLEAYKEKIELQHAVPLITALFDIGDELPDEPLGFFSLGAEMHASRIIRWYLMGEQDSRKRGQVLKEAMRATSGLFLPVMRTSLEEPQEERREDPYNLLVEEYDLKDLRNICVEKIRQSAASGALTLHPKIQNILYQWGKWTSPEEPRAWVAGLIESKDGLLSFLSAFLQRSTSQGLNDYVSRLHWHIRLKNIEDFAPADVVARKIEQLPLGDLTDKQQRAIRAFQKAFKRRQEGRSDDDWRDDDDE